MVCAPPCRWRARISMFSWRDVARVSASTKLEEDGLSNWVNGCNSLLLTYMSIQLTCDASDKFRDHGSGPLMMYTVPTGTEAMLLVVVRRWFPMDDTKTGSENSYTHRDAIITCPYMTLVLTFLLVSNG